MGPAVPEVDIGAKRLKITIRTSKSGLEQSQIPNLLRPSRARAIQDLDTQKEELGVADTYGPLLGASKGSLQFGVLLTLWTLPGLV